MFDKQHMIHEPGEGTTILYLLDTLMEIAGSERNLFELATRLKKRGWHPIVVCMRGGNMVLKLRGQGIETHDLRLKKIYGIRAFSAALALAGIIRRNRVSIMVTYHESSDYFGGIVGRLSGVPVIISSRRDMGYSLKPHHILAYRFFDRFFDRILAVSDAVKATVADREKIPWSSIVTIYNGVEPSLFESRSALDVRAAFGISPAAPVIGIMAVVRPIKGHEYFLEAAARVAREFPDARFLVIGWTPDDAYYTRLKQMVRRLGLEQKVIFTGGIADRAAALSCMDISVFSSLNEGFSNAVIESMAAAKPVIATRSGGTAEAVVDGVTGILVPPKDPGALSGAMAGLLRNPDEARRMGENGKLRAIRRFNIERMVNETESLYFDLLGNRESRTSEAVPLNVPRLKFIARRTLKQMAGNALYYSGYMKTMGNNGIQILAYHRVTDNRFLLPGMGIRTGHFEEHMRYLKEECAPITLEEAFRVLRFRGTIPRHAVVVTFDDGYRDNYLNAYPVLRRYGIPATIFLTAGVIDQGGMLWFDRITELFGRTPLPFVDLTSYGLGIYTLPTLRARIHTAAIVVEKLKHAGREQRDRQIISLSGDLAVPAGSLNHPPLMMSWEEILEMKENGITFGSHGMSHTILAHLSPEELEFEIGHSRAIIRRKAGVDTRLFAYPNGSATDFDRASEHMLEKYDFDGGLTLIKGLNDCTLNPFALRRVCVTEGMESDAFGRFSRPLFAAAISGALN